MTLVEFNKIIKSNRNIERKKKTLVRFSLEIFLTSYAMSVVQVRHVSIVTGWHLCGTLVV